MKIIKLSKLPAFLLVMSLVFSTVIPAAAQEPEHAAEVAMYISSFAPLTEEIAFQSYAAGAAAIFLPETLEAEVLGQRATVPVTWAQDPGFDGASPGIYVFTAVLTDMYTLAAGTEVPSVCVAITEVSARDVITAFAPLEPKTQNRTIPNGYKADLLLPDSLYAEIGGQWMAVPVSWFCENFDVYTPGIYVFTTVLPEKHSTDVLVKLPIIYLTVTETFETSVITGFATLEAAILNQTVQSGQRLNLLLPDFLYAEINNQWTYVPVTWICEDFDDYASGKYVFLAALPEGYSIDAWVELPAIYVTVASETSVITGFVTLESDMANQTIQAGQGSSLLLPDFLYAEINNQWVDVPVTWICKDLDVNIPGIYVFSAVFPEKYSVAEYITAPIITVEVTPQISSSFNAAGTGTEQDPLIIATGEQLAEFADIVKSGGYIGDVEASTAWLTLINDIDLTGFGDADGWTPIGTEDNPFTGSFDGSGFRITGLYTNRSDSYQGLFGYLSGVVKNLAVTDGIVNGGNGVGGIAGWIIENGVVENAYFLGNIQGNTCVGGIVGNVGAGGTVRNCYTLGSVSGTSCVGGVVGNLWGSVSYSYSASMVFGGNYSGGIAGYVNGGAVVSCAALNLSVSGDISGRVAVTDASTGGKLENNAAFSGMTHVGGMASEYGISSNSNGANVSVRAINTAFFYTDSLGFDSGHWLCENNAMPLLLTSGGVLINGQTSEMPAYLIASEDNTEAFFGDGTELFPFEIWTAADMALLAALINTGEAYSGGKYYEEAYYKLMKDIDITGFGDVDGWTPIGSENHPFTGTFDGGNHNITGLFINRPYANNQGLFGCIINGAVKNLIITGGSITGNWFVGSLSGRTENANIENNNVSFEVAGKWFVGGVAGLAVSGVLENCAAAGHVTGEGYVGGIAGYVDAGVVQNCESSGDVTGSWCVGGLAGVVTAGEVINGHVSGNVAGDCYVGGIAGYISTNCTIQNNADMNTTVSGVEHVGGVVGYTEHPTD